MDFNTMFWKIVMMTNMNQNIVETGKCFDWMSLWMRFVRFFSLLLLLCSSFVCLHSVSFITIVTTKSVNIAHVLPQSPFVTYFYFYIYSFFGYFLSIISSSFFEQSDFPVWDSPFPFIASLLSTCFFSLISSSSSLLFLLHFFLHSLTFSLNENRILIDFWHILSLYKCSLCVSFTMFLSSFAFYECVHY